MTAEWHLPTGVAQAYASGRLDTVRAWSVETHLEACAPCRGVVAMAVAGSTAARVVALARPSVQDLPAQPAYPPATGRRRIRMLVGSGPALLGAWLLAAVLVTALAAALDAAGVTMGERGVPWLVLLAPAVPVLGVAACYGPGVDPVYELLAATPEGGLAVLLWRTLAVLGLSIPLALVAGAFLRAGGPTLWLLPSVGLVALTLALGSALGVSRGGCLVAAGWTLAVLVPTFGGRAPMVAQAEAGAYWLLLAFAAAGVVAARRNAWSRLASVGAAR